MHVAVYAPVGRDAVVLSTLLEAVHLQPLVCTSAAQFTAALDENALLAIATEEGLTRCSADQLAQQLKRQPLWSNIPIIALADANALLPGGATTVLERLGGVMLITRPLRHEVLMLAVLSARRTRLLQFQVRDQLAQLSTHAAELEQRVDERTAALAQEVRERRQVETSLLEARRLESLGRLTGGVAHDFNNLLQVIVGATQLLKLLGRDAPTLQKPIDSITRAADQGARLTQQLLAFARRQPMQNAVLLLDEHLPAAAQLLRHSLGRDITLHIDIVDTPWLVQTDLAQLEMALLNLVINARDAMPEGGAATLTVRNLRLPDSSLPELARLGGEYVEVALRDEGHGMSEAVAQQAFEPFFTTKPLGKGTGLGLSQVYGYAQQSRGATYLRSTADGTTVGIVLPRAVATVATAADGISTAANHPGDDTAGVGNGNTDRGGDGHGGAMPSRSAQPDPQSALQGLRVLCVEDDPFVAEVAVELFAALGCQVCCAFDADAALLSRFEEIDLVFSDVRMPGSMDGVELAHHLARSHPHLPVVLASGFIGEPERLAGLSLEFVRKPYSSETVLAAACAALARKAPAAS